MEQLHEQPDAIDLVQGAPSEGPAESDLSVLPDEDGAPEGDTAPTASGVETEVPLAVAVADDQPAPDASAESIAATQGAPVPTESQPVIVKEAVPPATGETQETLIAFEGRPRDFWGLWLFVAYDLVWLAFAGVVVWQLLLVPAGTAAYESAVYPLTLLGGLLLTLAGPALIVASWLAVRGSREEPAPSSFTTMLVRGSFATLLGVALWWAALIAVDQVRLGSLF